MSEDASFNEIVVQCLTSVGQVEHNYKCVNEKGEWGNSRDLQVAFTTRLYILSLGDISPIQF